MKVVVAVDSFKGSMTSMEAGMAVKAGILAAKKDAEVIVKPLADGGEGTTDALIEGLKGERVDVTVTGPYHEPVQAYYGYLRESNTAVMEMATAAGITLSDKKEPMTATTYGVGELILHAIGRGIRNFIIGIGGSATNDGGVGMLKALGYRFLDEKGEDAGEGGQALARIASVEISDKKELLSQCNFRIACDVTNPLCGSQGATYIYASDSGCRHEKLCRGYCQSDRQRQPECGRCRCGRRTWICISELSGWRADARNTTYSGCCPYRR